jgi:hypothetical protein
VHTNKTLGKLRDRQLASWTDGALVVNDMTRLMRLAGMETEEPQRRPLM